jgi:hypothetical protein
VGLLGSSKEVGGGGGEEEEREWVDRPGMGWDGLCVEWVGM